MSDFASAIWALIVLAVLTIVATFATGFAIHGLVDVFMAGWEAGR